MTPPCPPAWVLAFSFLLVPAASSVAAPLTIAARTCEFATDPLGIDALHPRLSWDLESDRRGARQTAYEIQVASDPAFTRLGDADGWDSGKVASGRSLLVPYAGPGLHSRQRCYWRVRVWDEQGAVSAFSGPAFWEMGLLAPGDWRAGWIGYTAGWPGRALYFRHFFEVKKPVARARAYIAGVGYYELRLNGAKVGDHVLDPGWTDYAKRTFYVTYDIGPGLVPGANAVGIVVGSGWYGQPTALLQIELTYADGTRETIGSEGGSSHSPAVWQVSGGPVTRNSVYDGETYDARLEKAGWDRAGTPAAPLDRLEDWVPAVPVAGPAGRLLPQTEEPIRIVRSFAPARLTEARPGRYVFDAGRNLAGWAELHVHGRRGNRITLKFAETLNPDGTVNQENLRTARATDEYILKGDGDEVWEPRFTYHGFRYVQWEGDVAPTSVGSIKLKMVRSDVAPIGSFACSDDLLNRIQRMVVATEGSNLHSVPTDCPQRNERMGWLNDMSVRVEEGVYNFRLPLLYAKWGEDIRDTQSAEGAIADTAPYKWGHRAADPICASYMLIAWYSYLHYGDLAVIRDHYDSYRQWIDYLVSRTRDGIVTYSNWGDWSPPAAFAVSGSPGSSAISAKTPGELMSTGALYYQTRLLARMAALIGRDRDIPRLNALAEKTYRAFNDRYWDGKAGGYGSNNQACNAWALYAGLVPKDRMARVRASLIQAVDRNDGHLSTGNLCTKYLLEDLGDAGRNDVAYRIADQRTYPSWGFMLDHGATTLWERWEELTGAGMNSHDHPMMGSVSSWFYKYLGGIRSDPAGPGFRHFIVRPLVVDHLNWVETSYESPYGRIHTGWRRDRAGLSLKVSVPVNSSATVYLPCGAGDDTYESGVPADRANLVRLLRREAGACVLEVPSGDYSFTVRPHGAPAAAAVDVPAGDSRIVYMGRWAVSANEAVTVNSGAALKVHFRGRGLRAHFDAETLADPPQIWITCDGGPRTLATIELPWVDVAASGAGDHTLLLEVKDVSQNAERWTPPLQSVLRFRGFEVDAGGGLLDPGPIETGAWSPSAPRLAVFGDSITQGVRCLSMEVGPNGADGTRAYGYLAAQALGARVTQVGFGGQGIVRSGWGGVPPAGETFDFVLAGKRAPRERYDAVVINEGTNDSGVPAATFQPAYEAYLRQIRAAQPSALVFALRPFNGAQAAAIEAAVAALRDPRIVYVDTAGWLDSSNPADYTERPVGIHPTVAGQAKVAARLAEVLRNQRWNASHPTP